LKLHFKRVRNPGIVWCFLTATIGGVAGLSLAVAVTLILYRIVSPVAANAQDFLSCFRATSHDIFAKKVFFGSSYVFGVMGSIIAPLLLNKREIDWRPLAVGLLAFCVFSKFILKPVIEHAQGWVWLTLFAVSTAVVIAIAYRDRKGEDLLERTLPLAPPQATAGRYRLADTLVWLLLIAIMFPSNASLVAYNMHFDPHPVPFMIGQSLYLNSHSAIPGIDYFVLYGLAPGVIFHYLIGTDVVAAYSIYVVLFCATVAAFFILLYHFLIDLYSSRLWAAGTSIALLLLYFHAPQHFLDIQLNDPTSWPVRYFLFPAFAIVAVRALVLEIDSCRVGPWASLTGVIIGCALFWNTETGIDMALSFLGVQVLWMTPERLLDRERRPQIIRLLSIGGVVIVLAIMIFFSLAILSFGSGVLSLKFARELLAPLWIYNSGYSAVPIFWKDGIEVVLLVVIIPIVVFASIGTAVGSNVIAGINLPKRDAASLCLLGIFGLLILLKFINRSYWTLWYVNGFAVLVVCGYWLRRIQLGVTTWSVHLARTWGAAVATSAVALLFGLGANGYALGLVPWWHYPSIAKSLMTARLPAGKDNDELHVTKRDVALVRGLTRPNERVAFYSKHDWAWLLAADRAPRSTFIPSVYMHFRSGFNKSYDGAPLIFVEIDPASRSPAKGYCSETDSLMKTMLHDRYKLFATGDYLNVYKLRSRNLQ